MPAGGAGAERMRAAVLVAPRRVEVQRVPVPRPGPGQVAVRVEGCGLCGSNLPVWEGRPWFEYPLAPGAPGHEGWGQVVAVGPGAHGVRAGDRVAFLSQNALAEIDLCRAEDAVPLPGDLAIPGEPFGCAWNVARRSELQAGGWLAVVGAGFLGASLVRLAARAGARVMAISRRAYSLGIARAMGAERVLAWEDDDRAVIDRALELTGGVGCPRVIEAVGSQRALSVASALVATGGRLVIAGYHQDGPREVDMQSWNWRGIDVINAHERDSRRQVEGMRAAVGLAVEGTLDATALLTHSFTLEEISGAFEALRTRPSGSLKAVVVP